MVSVVAWARPLPRLPQLAIHRLAARLRLVDRTGVEFTGATALAWLTT
jgi:hypothetical protein